MQRRRSAILAWGLPFVAALGLVAVPSDVEPPSPPVLAHEGPPTVTASVAVHPPAPTTAPPTAPRLTAVLSPPSAYASSTFVTSALEAGPQPAIVAQEPPVPPTPSATGVAESVAQRADEYVLEIPDIALSEPVVPGDQTELDQGNVTAVDWSAKGYPASCLPNEGCTVWLAGHRSTHGSVFARLPELTIGASIIIHFSGEIYAYTVSGVADVPGTAPPSVISGDLVLQTSLPGNRRLLVYADAV